MRKKVTSKKAQKETDDADYQLVKVGQNKVPQVGRLQLPKPSSDWGESWTRLTLGLSATLWHLAVNPTNPEIVYGYGDEYAYRSTDAWNTYTLYTLPIDAIAEDPTNAGTLYSIAAGIVYRSTDRGDTWSSLAEGLADVAQSLAVSGSNPPMVFAGTLGGGVFKNAATFTLNRGEYCVGGTWKVRIINSLPGATIRLLGVSNGTSWEWPGWGTTDNDGSFTATGTFGDGSQGTHSLRVEIGGVESNVVSLSISNCQQ